MAATLSIACVAAGLFLLGRGGGAPVPEPPDLDGGPAWTVAGSEPFPAEIDRGPEGISVATLDACENGAPEGRGPAESLLGFSVSCRILVGGAVPAARTGVLRLSEVASVRDSLDVHVEARTDGEGRATAEFRLPREDVPGGACAAELACLHSEGVAFRTRVVLRAGEPLDLGDVILEPARALAGRVVDPDGRPIAGAWVCATPARPDDPGGVSERRRYRVPPDPIGDPVSTDAGGAFTIAGLPLDLSVRAWASRITGVWLSPGIVGPGRIPPEGLTIELPRVDREAVVSGRVYLPEGDPASGAIVEGRFSGGSPSWYWKTRCDPMGRFDLAFDGAGNIDLRVTPAGSARLPLVRERIPTGTRDLEIVLPVARTAELRVFSTAGRPPAGFRYDILPAASLRNGELRWRPRLFTGAADATTGSAEIPVPGEPFVVGVRSRGFDPAWIGPLDPDSSGPFTVSMTPRPGIRGRVSRRGEPVAGAVVQVRPVRGYLSRSNRMLHYAGPLLDRDVTGPDGSFVLDPPLVFGSDFVVSAFSGGAEVDVRVERFSETEGRTVALELPVELGRIEGTVSAGGADVSGILVGISTGNGEVRTTRADAGGRFRFDGVSPGEWQCFPVDEAASPGLGTDHHERTDLVAIPYNAFVRPGETAWVHLEAARD